MSQESGSQQMDVPTMQSSVNEGSAFSVVKPKSGIDTNIYTFQFDII